MASHPLFLSLSLFHSVSLASLVTSSAPTEDGSTAPSVSLSPSYAPAFLLLFSSSSCSS